MPKISIAIPYHDTPRTAFFLSRLLKSIDEQTFKDYEIVLTNEPGMAHNHNAAILKSKGEIVQMMQMDDYFYSDTALLNIVSLYDFWSEKDTRKEWGIIASIHDSNGIVLNPHVPHWTDDMYKGNNRLGSISTLSMRRDTALLFEEPLSWVVDCDLYYRLYLKYGEPIITSNPLVAIDTRPDRLSHTLSNELKANEVEYLMKKYAK